MIASSPLIPVRGKASVSVLALSLTPRKAANRLRWSLPGGTVTVHCSVLSKFDLINYIPRS